VAPTLTATAIGSTQTSPAKEGLPVGVVPAAARALTPRSRALYARLNFTVDGACHKHVEVAWRRHGDAHIWVMALGRDVEWRQAGCENRTPHCGLAAQLFEGGRS
jgi:hypothetical protein